MFIFGSKLKTKQQLTSIKQNEAGTLYGIILARNFAAALRHPWRGEFAA
jgi:hypothetical protein